jgi:hypothetical protein
MEPDEFADRLSESVLCELLHIQFFDAFTHDEQRLLFQLAALVRATDCINTPSRVVAERQTATRGEGVLEGFLSSLRLQYTTETESRALADELKVAYVVTPDVLFASGPVEIPGVPTAVRWVDSKNGWFVPGLSLPTKLASLRRQMLKYAYHIGPGLVLWHKGYFEAVLADSPACVLHASITRSPTGDPIIVNCRAGTGQYTKIGVSLPGGRIGQLIGRGGERIKAIEAEYGVLVVVPTAPGGGKITVHIVGCSAAAARSAEGYIQTLLRQPRKGSSTSSRRRRCAEDPTPTAMLPPQLARRGRSLPGAILQRTVPTPPD